MWCPPFPSGATPRLVLTDDDNRTWETASQHTSAAVFHTMNKLCVLVLQERENRGNGSKRVKTSIKAKTEEQNLDCSALGLRVRGMESQPAGPSGR